MAVEREAVAQVRQGDVLLTPQFGVPQITLSGAIKAGRSLLSPDGLAVLAVGKGGGHPHEVVGDLIQFVETGSGSFLRQQPDDQVSRVLVTGPDGATLRHDEHEDIKLPPNAVYVVFRQLETLVGDGNNEREHVPTGIRANDQPRATRSRRYVED